MRSSRRCTTFPRCTFTPRGCSSAISTGTSPCCCFPSSGLTSISVHLQSGENKMTPANLGVVFGRECSPSQRHQNLTVFSATVLRSRDPSREFR